jgi:predicted transcriptional regulator
MKRIEIEILKPNDALDAFKATWEKAEKGKNVTPRLIFGNLKELFSAITEKRMELIRFIAENEGYNIRQIALEIGRDYKNVHTDVSELIELGLLEKDSNGFLLAPYDEIVIHTTIRDAA